ncbi:hypothetical protein [Hoeflea alexandrii]|uniref:Uncharacterized protein n=1 Tax=Hoeflea alexandrii TaxID=288436 RepID=A0ABT1CN33_9HYPH|nr:hypothetical protein [Hoeflea alexandrii]MCO6407041.1 hypothetical protein [Hoeflea alexandrii]MCY0154518.1 hypothetical protein [Hoeflea alexandrii]
MTDRPKTPSNDRRLSDIVRDVKIAAADRTDVVVDMRDADRARLELLAEEIRPVLADIDPDDDRFDFGLSKGLQPRLWIDAVAHVHMGHDRRVFRFVRDTRLGRVIMSDTSDMAATADAVSRYIAERVIERERILAGDFEELKAGAAGHKMADEAAADAPAMPRTEPDNDVETVSETAKPQASEAARQADRADQTRPTETSVPARTGGAGLVLGTSWFILGCVAGAAALVVAFWDRISAMIG